MTFANTIQICIKNKTFISNANFYCIRNSVDVYRITHILKGENIHADVLVALATMEKLCKLHCVKEGSFILITRTKQLLNATEWFEV